MEKSPPEAIVTKGNAPNVTESHPAVSVRLEVLKNRPDFLRAAKALRKPMPGFLLQARRRNDDEAPSDVIRVGYTCSKKVGNAIARNRAKRRLREIARAHLPNGGKPGWDYVLVGRPGVTSTRDFSDLLKDMQDALHIIHSPKPKK
ncbi:ribonuclease P protein component [Cochlodiniinecator piscidefendens]|uniref:ribonuclease P protein component n=1 Tax=Cochlodiniinecator piscidefendens TaxID=2715756 RepID=UPI001409BBB9|nr:ribonuclease P protein component [Cochlodiniinecator piscidefendens]